MNIIDRFRLDGKKALVTGAGSGIGKAYSIALAEAGADVAVIDIDFDSASKVSEKIKKIGRESIEIEADTGKPEDIKKMVATVVKNWGRLDIAVNNVGISIRGHAEDFPLEDWDKVVDLNLRGNFLCSQEEGRVMIAQKYGKIIFTSSLGGNLVHKPNYQISMSVSKAGEQHLTRCLAAEWAKYGIRVNCINPGPVITPPLNAPDLVEFKKNWINNCPVGRIGEVEDLQGIIVYLASDVSDFMTGQNLTFDGGYGLF